MVHAQSLSGGAFMEVARAATQPSVILPSVVHMLKSASYHARCQQVSSRKEGHASNTDIDDTGAAG
jgi:hypothetical protein